MFYVLTSDLSFYLFHEFNNSSNVMIIVYGVKKIKSFFFLRRSPENWMCLDYSSYSLNYFSSCVEDIDSCVPFHIHSTVKYWLSNQFLLQTIALSSATPPVEYTEYTMPTPDHNTTIMTLIKCDFEWRSYVHKFRIFINKSLILYNNYSFIFHLFELAFRWMCIDRENLQQFKLNRFSSKMVNNSDTSFIIFFFFLFITHIWTFIIMLL